MNWEIRTFPTKHWQAAELIHSLACSPQSRRTFLLVVLVPITKEGISDPSKDVASTFRTARVGYASAISCVQSIIYSDKQIQYDNLISNRYPNMIKDRKTTKKLYEDRVQVRSHNSSVDYSNLQAVLLKT